jgi:hypothetical protein
MLTQSLATIGTGMEGESDASRSKSPRQRQESNS